eukprot:TRINITY_DN1657_c0_g2_i1.p2 TRINITY_DN1657_c0_g2~~TRINITY_DN1657_c0_g2_i1.p2  ORF type:complete len:631 (+),score=329.93 TRINITY_DN1657_c0_g2_i1:58-1950(+)
MDVYQQAARAMQASEEGKGQLKQLCLQKEVQKKRATYAVAAEAAKHVKVVDGLLKESGFYEANPTFWPNLARVMVYDALFGTGLKGEVRKGAGYAVKKHLARIKRSLHELMKKQKVASPQELIAKKKPRIPIYVRVNTVVTTVNDVIAAFVASGWRQMEAPDPAAVLEAGKAQHYSESDKRKRAADGDDEPEAKRQKDESGKAVKKGKKKKGKKGAEDAAPAVPQGHDRKVFYRDPMLTSLLVFPPSSKFALIKHDVIRTHKAVIQDKASCLPPYVLLHCLPMVSALDRENPEEPTAGTTVMGPVLDATSAPGNKTSLLAALSRGKRQVYAVEKDEGRAELLQKRLTDFKSPKVEVINRSFLDILPEEYPQVEGILLDPSCSGSGIVDRVCDDNLKTKQAGEKEEDEKRLQRLADFQFDMIRHAMTFLNVRRIVYSTCSIHRQENEEVVQRVMDADADEDGRWQLADIMPGTWGNRALPVFQNAQHCIRCSPSEDHTNGFFVACFEKAPSGKKKRKRLSKQEKKKRKRAKLEAEAAGESGDEVEVVVENASDDEDEDAVVETSARKNAATPAKEAPKKAAKEAPVKAAPVVEEAEDDKDGDEEMEEFEEVEEDEEMEEFEEVEEMEEDEE